MVQYSKTPFIFIVDDVVKNLQVIGSTLEEEGYDIAVASNGIEAIEMIKSDLPDLILLDVMMPDMNGYEVCEKLKEDEQTKKIPIIFLTAKTETEDIVNGFNHGGVDYITKPFKKEELLVRIKNHLDLKFSHDIISNQNSRLIKLNNEKNEFLGITAHDLKNPISAIMSLSELIVNETYNISYDEAKDIVNDIYNAAEQMFQLVVDLLDVNAIEEGKINFSLSNYNMVVLLRDSMKKFELSAKNKNINIHLNYENENIIAYADEAKTKQIIDNVLSNAIKFSPFDKNIWIKTSIIENDKRVLVSIKDEGPGLSDEDVKKLFGKFSRLSARPTNNENSTGLGLSIVKKLIECMDGKIWCESVLGEGCDFKFTLPIASEESLLLDENDNIFEQV